MPGDVVTLSIRAGGLRQRMSYRVEAVQDDRRRSGAGDRGRGLHGHLAEPHAGL